MKKLLLITGFLAVLLLQGKAQEEYQYVPIDDNAEWSVSTMKFRTCGDTVINEKNYLKVYQQRNREPFDFDFSKAKYYCALRNDTLNKRVYIVYPHSLEVYVYEQYNYSFLFNSTDTTEFLLYDFSLNMGDTVSIYEFSNTNKLFKINMIRVEDVALFHTTNTNNHPISYSNTDSMQIMENEDYRRRILMRMSDIDFYYYNNVTVWTEEIGSVHGLTRHFLDDLQTADGGFWSLLCYTNENELLLSTPWNIDNNCFYIDGVNIKENENECGIFKLYPNPSSKIIKIESVENTDLSNCKIELINIVGKSVYSTDFHNSIELDISPYPNGFYFVKITQHNKPLFYRKVIIQK